MAKGDPFELPAKPNVVTLPVWKRLVYDETESTFYMWRGRLGSHGRVTFGTLPGIAGTIGTARFEDTSSKIVRVWENRKLNEISDINGYWWLWPDTIVLPPWEMPASWGQLRRIAKAKGLNLDDIVRWMLPTLRGAKSSSILLLGYPIAKRVGDEYSEVHWDAVVLPSVLDTKGKPPNGFRPNTKGWWHRDRYGSFADKVRVQHLTAENWASDRLQARGRLPNNVRESFIAVIGLGALGSAIAEMLVRAGVKKLVLIDSDKIEGGNVCRHTATLADIDVLKVEAVARRLRQISPEVHVFEVPGELLLDPDTPTVTEPEANSSKSHLAVTMLDNCDALVDCTASDEILKLLSLTWWSVPRLFASFSLGYGGKRLFSYGFFGNIFSQLDFSHKVSSWLARENQSDIIEERFEGAGCWSPLFPARIDDVLLAAATCVKEFETMLNLKPQVPRFNVFEQLFSQNGFQGFMLRTSADSSGISL